MKQLKDKWWEDLTCFQHRHYPERTPVCAGNYIDDYGKPRIIVVWRSENEGLPWTYSTPGGFADYDSDDQLIIPRESMQERCTRELADLKVGDMVRICGDVIPVLEGQAVPLSEFQDGVNMPYAIQLLWKFKTWFYPSGRYDTIFIVPGNWTDEMIAQLENERNK